MASGWSIYASSLALVLIASVPLWLALRGPDRRDPERPGAERCVFALATPDVREGDLVFRRAHGLWSGLFASVSTRDQRFSHVGVLVRERERWMVVHAEADDHTGVGSVRAEPVDEFLRDTSSWEFRRIPLSDTARGVFVSEVTVAWRRALPFDLHFSLESRSEVYCTELVWAALATALGRDPVPHKTRWRELTVVAIDDLLDLGEVVDPRPVGEEPLGTRPQR